MSRKNKSGIRRGGGSRAKRQSSGQEVQAPPQTLEVSRATLDASRPEATRELQDMANRGEVPFKLSGSGEDRERIYEEFDRLYPDPPGILGDYRLDESMGSRQVGIFFNYGMAEAESPSYVRYPRYGKDSEAAKRGLIKHEIYKTRPAVELALSSRHHGYASLEQAQKYGKRVLSNAEREQADREIISQVESLLRTPMSRAGLEYNRSEWRRQGNGWVRLSALSASDMGYRDSRNGVEI